MRKSPALLLALAATVAAALISQLLRNDQDAAVWAEETSTS